MNPLTKLFTIFIMETKRKTVPLLKLKFFIGFIAIGIFLIMSHSCSENAKSTIDVMEGIIPPPPPPPPYTVENGDTTWINVDEMPVFSGGDTALLVFIAKAAKYPTSAKENGIQGRVVVSFIVNEEGKVSKAKIVKSIDPELDAEAIRVVNSLPSFEKPAIMNGKPVSVSYMVPISFSLK
jgi:TonB family protein